MEMFEPDTAVRWASDTVRMSSSRPGASPSTSPTTSPGSSPAPSWSRAPPSAAAPPSVPSPSAQRARKPRTSARSRHAGPGSSRTVSGASANRAAAAPSGSIRPVTCTREPAGGSGSREITVTGPAAVRSWARCAPEGPVTGSVRTVASPAYSPGASGTTVRAVHTPALTAAASSPTDSTQASRPRARTARLNRSSAAARVHRSAATTGAQPCTGTTAATQAHVAARTSRAVAARSRSQVLTALIPSPGHGGVRGSRLRSPARR